MAVAGQVAGIAQALIAAMCMRRIERLISGAFMAKPRLEL
jgi:hypothetical protein